MSSLTPREQRILDLLDDEWQRPMDLGGGNSTHHSATLRNLVKKGYAEKRRRDSLMNALGSSRGSYIYRRAQKKPEAS